MIGRDEPLAIDRMLLALGDADDAVRRYATDSTVCNLLIFTSV